MVQESAVLQLESSAARVVALEHELLIEKGNVAELRVGGAASQAGRTQAGKGQSVMCLCCLPACLFACMHACGWRWCLPGWLVGWWLITIRLVWRRRAWPGPRSRTCSRTPRSVRT